MRHLLSLFVFFLSAFIVGCNTNSMSGIYVCDQSQKKADSTIVQGGNVDAFIDLTCTIQELDFKGNSTVELRMKNGPIVTSYVVDKEHVRVKGSGADILFKILDDKTLSGEGPVEAGLYTKK